MEHSVFDIAVFKSKVLALMPVSPVQYAVTAAQQEKEISSLQETVGSRRFFFVVNLEKFQAEHAFGLEKWLGYSESDFSFMQYLDTIVHPGKRKAMVLIATQLCEMLCKGKYPLTFMSQRYSSLVALRHYCGKYFLVNKISSVFQYDKNNCLTAYLNEFTIIGDYNDQPMDPRFFLATGEEEPGGEAILKKSIDQFFRSGVFTERELQIARKLAYEPGITKSRIAADLDLSVHTVDEYGKRFLNKARPFFNKSFAGVAEAAIYIRKEGLL